MNQIKPPIGDRIFRHLFKIQEAISTPDLIARFSPKKRNITWEALRRLERQGFIGRYKVENERTVRECAVCGNVRKIHCRNCCRPCYVKKPTCVSCAKARHIAGNGRCDWCYVKKLPRIKCSPKFLTFWYCLRSPVKMRPKLGDRVRIILPENPRIHGGLGDVIGIEDWGAHVSIEISGTGRYRLGWHEMELVTSPETIAESKAKGYTGDVCEKCQGSRMVRAGACLRCEDCGDTTSCG